MILFIGLIPIVMMLHKLHVLQVSLSWNLAIYYTHFTSFCTLGGFLTRTSEAWHQPIVLEDIDQGKRM